MLTIPSIHSRTFKGAAWGVSSLPVYMPMGEFRYIIDDVAGIVTGGIQVVGQLADGGQGTVLLHFQL